jgi:serine O-acetyltransferase
MNVWRLMLSDARRTYDYVEGNPAKRFVICLAAPGVHAAVVYRFGHWARERSVPLRALLDPLYHLLYFVVRVLWGIEISRQATIGPGLYIGHFGGIVVSRHAVIGANCNLSQEVTIGVSGDGANRGAPKIGDDVYIAPGAKIFGPITIGHRAKIGANAVIHADVPDGAVAVAASFQIISAASG